MSDGEKRVTLGLPLKSKTARPELLPALRPPLPRAAAADEVSGVIRHPEKLSSGRRGSCPMHWGEGEGQIRQAR